jgi:capsular exopolysaccharide synthesis family protein
VFAKIDERFRQIAARCLDMTRSAGSQSVAITSAVAGEGASSVAIGVAVAAARNIGSDVLLVETDMQHPQLADDFKLESHAGLSDYLAADVDLETVVQPTRVPNVWLLPAGRAIANPGPLIRSKRFEELMTTLHSGYETIIIDVPPLLTSPHAAVVASQAEGLVLVVRAGRTHIQDAAGALKEASQVPVRGVVLNGTRQWFPTWIARLMGVSRVAIE